MTQPMPPVPEQSEVLPELDVFPPQRQRRWTVLLRALLLIPQYLALYVVGIAVLVVMVIAWFGTLAKGRLPSWCADFLAEYVVWWTQVDSYFCLLVDTYPPFGSSPDYYPVSVEFAPGGRLNRAAVLFRFILFFPAAFLLGFLAAGWLILAVFFWLTVLILGRTPRPVFEVSAAIVRYRMRAYAYYTMLSPAYPKRLFGDPAPVPSPPSSTRPLLLSGGGRALLIAIIVLGVLGQVPQYVPLYTSPPIDRNGYYPALDTRSINPS